MNRSGRTVHIARRTWTFSRPAMPPPARSRWPSACRRRAGGAPRTSARHPRRQHLFEPRRGTAHLLAHHRAPPRRPRRQRAVALARARLCAKRRPHPRAGCAVGIRRRKRKTRPRPRHPPRACRRARSTFSKKSGWFGGCPAKRVRVRDPIAPEARPPSDRARRLTEATEPDERARPAASRSS